VISAHAFVRPEEAWSAWAEHPLVIVPIVVASAWYAIGIGEMPLWPRRRSFSFGAGVAAVITALVSPLDALGETTFSWHMAQHLVLVLVAAPLLAYGAPSVPMLRALPRRLRRAVGSLPPGGFLRRVGRRLGNPLVAVAAHTMALWFWHLPAAYESAIASEAVHALEHVCFLGTSFWFWATIIPSHRRSAAPYPLRTLAVFGGLLQSGALGALLVFASRSLYAIHADGPAAWGLSPLEDQQLAGVLMWVPPAGLYLTAMSILLARWLRLVEARMRVRESVPAGDGRVTGRAGGSGAEHA
jgi:putative membrane protein